MVLKLLTARSHKVYYALGYLDKVRVLVLAGLRGYGGVSTLFGNPSEMPHLMFEQEVILLVSI